MVHRNILNRAKPKQDDLPLYHPIITRFNAPPGQLDPKYKNDVNANDLGEISGMQAQVNGAKPPVVLKDESDSVTGQYLNLVDEAALPFYVDDQETEGDETLYPPLPACIQKTYDKAEQAKADSIPVFDIAAHEDESRMRRLSRESAEREMERARNPSTLSDAEIKAIGDHYENPDNTLFR